MVALFINYKTRTLVNKISKKDNSAWSFTRVKSSIFISLSSKLGTGAIIGVLTAMWKLSNNGEGGEGLVLWIIIGILLLVPLTYSEVLFSQVTKKTPRSFIDYNLSTKCGSIYALGLVILYSFGFVGFQLMGIQNIIKIISSESFNYNFNNENSFLFIVLPIIIIATFIVITKNHKLFINALGSMISSVILIYGLFFAFFLFSTINFVPTYIDVIVKDFMNLKSAYVGIPLGFIIGLQRIVQISETGLGTSALASSNSENSPRREALIQTISTIITIFVAVIITSYIFTYGRYNLENVKLTASGFDRILGYLSSCTYVGGHLGKWVIIIFFIISGLTTILGSFHFLNTTIRISENKKILFYITLITISGIFSTLNFDVVFNAADLLMFIVTSINASAMFVFVIKNIKSFYINHTTPN